MGRTSDAKEKLLHVAFDLIWQHSYGSVSVDDICERADVKKGSFYYFFPSKSDLAVAKALTAARQKRQPARKWGKAAGRVAWNGPGSAIAAR